jgi:hypothetical protein
VFADSSWKIISTNRLGGLVVVDLGACLGTLRGVGVQQVCSRPLPFAHRVRNVNDTRILRETSARTRWNEDHILPSDERACRVYDLVLIFPRRHRPGESSLCNSDGG